MNLLKSGKDQKEISLNNWDKIVHNPILGTSTG